MLSVLSLSNALDALIPITRFNRGEANKIFDEVKESGCKVVVKNNTPACVLLTPERYQEMVDMIEDQYLLALAAERLKRGPDTTYVAEDVYSELDIESDDYENISMEYGVGFQ